MRKGGRVKKFIGRSIEIYKFSGRKSGRGKSFLAERYKFRRVIKIWKNHILEKSGRRSCLANRIKFTKLINILKNIKAFCKNVGLTVLGSLCSNLSYVFISENCFLNINSLASVVPEIEEFIRTEGRGQFDSSFDPTNNTYTLKGRKRFLLPVI